MDFEDVYARYFRKVYAFSYALSHNAHTAEEITQETFFRALKSPEQFDGRSSVDTYLCAIAHNLFVSSLRQAKKNAPDMALDFLPSDENIEADYEQKDTARRLHQLLHRLDEPYKEVFTLRVFGELSYAEIGALFDKGESWARVSCFRARQKLQGMLKEEENHA